MNAVRSQLVRSVERFVRQNAIGDKRYVITRAQTYDRLRMRVGIASLPAAWIAERGRTVNLIQGIAQHGACFGKARRTQNGHVRNRAEIVHVKAAVVRVTVVSDDTGAIDAEDNVQLLERNVMQHHVIGALQKA